MVHIWQEHDRVYVFGGRYDGAFAIVRRDSNGTTMTPGGYINIWVALTSYSRGPARTLKKHLRSMNTTTRYTPSRLWRMFLGGEDDSRLPYLVRRSCVTDIVTPSPISLRTVPMYSSLCQCCRHTIRCCENCHVLIQDNA